MLYNFVTLMPHACSLLLAALVPMELSTCLLHEGVSGCCLDHVSCPSPILGVVFFEVLRISMGAKVFDHVGRSDTVMIWLDVLLSDTIISL